MTTEPMPSSETLIKDRTYGEVRCLNCFKRVIPAPGAKTFKCPECSFEWRISWIAPDFPRIRGPVWDVNRQLAEKQVSQRR